MCTIQLLAQVLGDRELAGHEVIGALTKDDASFLHIFVKLQDVQSLDLDTAAGHKLSFVSPSQLEDKSPRSALTAALVASPKQARPKSALSNATR